MPAAEAAIEADHIGKTRFDLRQIEDVVDQTERVITAGPDRVDCTGLLRLKKG